MVSVFASFASFGLDETLEYAKEGSADAVFSMFKNDEKRDITIFQKKSAVKNHTSIIGI